MAAPSEEPPAPQNWSVTVTVLLRGPLAMRAGAADFLLLLLLLIALALASAVGRVLAAPATDRRLARLTRIATRRVVDQLRLLLLLRLRLRTLRLSMDAGQPRSHVGVERRGAG